MTYWTLFELKFCALTHDTKFRWPYWGLSVELWTCTWRIDLVNWQGGEVHWQQLPEVLPWWKMFCIWVCFCSLISHRWELVLKRKFEIFQFSPVLLLSWKLHSTDNPAMTERPFFIVTLASHFLPCSISKQVLLLRNAPSVPSRFGIITLNKKEKVRIWRIVITDCNLQKLCFRLPTHDKNEQNDHNAEKCKQHFNNMIASYGILVSQRDKGIRGIEFVNCGLLQHKLKLEYRISVCPCHYPKLGTEPDMDTRL